MDLSEVRPHPRSIAAQSAEELQQLIRTLTYVLERSQAEEGALVGDERRALSRLLPDLEHLQTIVRTALSERVRTPETAFGVPDQRRGSGGPQEPTGPTPFTDPHFRALYQPQAAQAAATLVSAWQREGRDMAGLHRALFDEAPAEPQAADLPAVCQPADSPPAPRQRTADELLDELMTRESESYSMNGTTKSLSLDTVFQFLARSRRTGRLLLRTSEETLTFALLDGDLVFTATDTPRPGQRIGELLVKEGKIDTGDLARALGERGDKSTRLGRILEDQLDVPHEALVAALQTQARLRYERARDAETAAFAFFPGPGAEVDSLRMKVLELLLESVRISDEARRPKPTAQV